MSPRAAKKKSSEQPQPNLVDNFDIVALRLLETQSLLQLDGGEIPSKITIQITAACRVDEQRKGVAIRCECTAATEHEADKSPAVSIRAAYECIYQAKTDKAMDSVSDLIQPMMISAQFHAWPYLRRHIHQTSIEMCVPPILLPLFGPSATALPIAKAGRSSAKAKAKSKTK